MNTRWSPFFKQLVTVTLLIGAVWLLVRARQLIPPVIIALLLAYLVSLPVGWILRRTGWPRTPVALVSQIVVVLLLLTIPALIAPWAVNAFTAFSNTLVNVGQALLKVEPEPLKITSTLTIDLGPFYQPVNRWLTGLLGGPDISSVQNLQGLWGPLAGSAAVVVRSAVSGVVWTLFVMVFGFYAVRDAPRFGRFVARNIPEIWRPELGRLWGDLTRVWNAFVRGQLLVATVMACVVGLMMTFLGVRNAPVLGLISGVMELVPAIGPVVAAIPGVLIALFLGSSWLPLPNVGFAILVAGSYFLLQQFENLFLVPYLVGSRVRLHPAVVIIGALAGLQLGGVLGVLLAAPTMASLRLLLGYAYRKLFDLQPFPAPEPTVDRSHFWAGRVAERGVRAILFDLDGTLIETDDEAVAAIARRLRLFKWVPEDERLRLARRWLMRSESSVNGLITFLDTLQLDGVLFRLSDALHRWKGHRKADNFLAVAGTVETVHELASRYRLGVVTSRNKHEALEFLSQYGLSALFSAVITRTDTPRLKPHPMPVLKAAEKLGVPPQQCVMVGDTEVDVRAAKAAGALAVGVLCGFGENDDFGDADLVIESTAQLGEWLCQPLTAT